MKKKLLIGGIGVLVAGGIFFTGAKIGASNDWTTQVESQASKRIASAGHNKKEEILAKSQDISAQMLDVLDPEIQRQEEELARLLEEYYQLKIQGLTDSPEFQGLGDRIEELKQLQLDRYKKEIDQIFSAM